MTRASVRELVAISVRGVVQGVGFRPFVYQLATRHNLKGWVRNTSGDVKINVEGEPGAITQFLRDLSGQAPPRASIESISLSRHSPNDYRDFEIRHSVAEEGEYQLISPDIATCRDCLREILSPDDRRYRYPFTNCTNCGPRFTIIEDIPYDRPRTTMRHFEMCPDCQREYDNPLDRRFHAQPNACPECGPTLQLLDARGSPVAVADAITRTSQLLREGKIVAIKGLGGFLLACDATRQATVNRLRRRKRRPAKPLAIMVASIEEARQYCRVNREEEKLLTAPHSPIVLLPWRAASPVAPAVAPGLKYLGVMLPYTPLHHLLLRETGLPLVMTSGNLSEEPIAKDNDEAVTRLSGIVDYYLVHNRDIYARYDDSVTMVARGIPKLVRRARGYAPYPVHLGFKSRQILACGAEEKNTFCLTRDEHAFLSQHIGDMDNLETMTHFRNTIALYRKLFRIEPEIIAHDLHPEYLPTKYALELAAGQNNLTLVPVQHHHAHIVSCMVDSAVKTPVIGVALDGTGYGPDGHIWGGEFLVVDYRGFTRMGHLEYLPLPGGELAIKKPYRTAIGYLLSLFGEDVLNDLPGLRGVTGVEKAIIARQVARKINSPLTSSGGRLFDAVSALIGVRGEIDYEAQAAIELEMIAAGELNESGDYPLGIAEQDGVNVRLQGMFAAIIQDLRRGVPPARIATRFHNTMARMISELCRVISKQTGISLVALSGGVFQNRLLLGKTVSRLETEGFEVLTHRQVPTNDGGIALGQAVIANFARR